jgi:miniconductance mechanosensitive channel
MTIEEIQTWIDQNPTLSPWVIGAALVILSVVVFLIARYFIARGLVHLSKRTETKYDDIIVDELRPFRFAWIAPLLVVYFLAGSLPEGTEIIRHITLFLILWLVVITADSLLNAVNAIYESSDYYRGESIQGYLDLGKVLLIVTALILSVSLFTGRSPLVLLSGLGVMMALLVLIFRDTILSFVASIQINSGDLLREGDWIEMPSFEADGSVVNISLHSVKVQNWDKTITVIPTYKFMDTPYKNWRGMEESGGRRIKRAVHIDLNSVRFCAREMLEKLVRIELIKDYVEAHLANSGALDPEAGPSTDSPFDRPQVTNVEVFQAYVHNYLKNRADLHQEGLTMLVRQLGPGPNGLPLEIYAFSRTIKWAEYEAIQAEIIDHMVAAMPLFSLRVFQQPTGADLQALAGVVEW